MNFKKENIEVFQELFNAHKDMIRSFDGCEYLELWQCTGDPGIFFTYSIWNQEELLEEYRKSDLFRSVWSQTKALFEDKPVAWSVELRAKGSEL